MTSPSTGRTLCAGDSCISVKAAAEVTATGADSVVGATGAGRPGPDSGPGDPGPRIAAADLRSSSRAEPTPGQCPSVDPPVGRSRSESNAAEQLLLQAQPLRARQVRGELDVDRLEQRLRRRACPPLRPRPTSRPCACRAASAPAASTRTPPRSASAARGRSPAVSPSCRASAAATRARSTMAATSMLTGSRSPRAARRRP